MLRILVRASAREALREAAKAWRSEFAGGERVYADVWLMDLDEAVWAVLKQYIPEHGDDSDSEADANTAAIERAVAFYLGRVS